MGRRMKKLTTAALIAGGVAMATSGAQAQDGGFLEASDWDVTIGGGAAFAPEYEGGDEYEVQLLPIIDAEWRDTVFISTTRTDGIAVGVNAFRSGNVRLGGGLNWRFGRDDDDIEGATNIPEVDGTAEMFLFGEIAFGYFKFDTTISQGIDAIQDNAHGGLLVDVGFSVGARVSPQLELIARLNGEYASDNYMDTFFSVPAASNLTQFDAGEGLKNVGLGFTANYRFNESITLVGIANYDLMVGDAADSPLVDDVGNQHQFYLGVGVTYTF